MNFHSNGRAMLSKYLSNSASRLAIAAKQGKSLGVSTCPVPCDHIPVRSWPLFKARQLMRDVIESLQGGKKS